MSRYIEVLLATLLLTADQLSKTWALTISSVYVFPWLNMHLTLNSGASFSILSNGHAWQYWLLISIAITACILIGRWWYNQNHNTTRLALMLILVGALGNLIDRFSYGAVIDFIDVHWHGWHFPTFNIADSCITVGAALILLFYKSTNRNR